METRNTLDQTIQRNLIFKENLKRGTDLKIPLMGSEVKRKRLSDITNTVSSSRVANCGAQVHDNPKEITCTITKDCFTQLMEENATLLKAVGERNKIIELSSIELQKLRFTLEKASQQNRMLAQANSQMLAEITSCRDRLKSVQHEFVCTTQVLKLKTALLDEKEALNKELMEKIRVMSKEEHFKLVEVATDGRQTQSETANVELHEKIIAKEEPSKCAEVITDSLRYHGVDNNMACVPNRKRTLRSQSTVAASTVSYQVEPEEAHAKRKYSKRSNNLTSEPHESEDNSVDINDAKVPAFSEMATMTVQVEAEGEDTRFRKSKCAEVAMNASRSLAVDDNITCDPSRKQTLTSLSASTAIAHKLEAKDKDDRRKSTRRSNNLTSEAYKTTDTFVVREEVKISAFSVINENPIVANPVLEETSGTVTGQVESKEEDDTRGSKSKCPEVETDASQCRAVNNNMTCDPSRKRALRSQYLGTTASVTHQMEEKEKEGRRRSSRRRSGNLTSETHVFEDDLVETEEVKVPASSVISRTSSETIPVLKESVATMAHQVERGVDDKRCRKSLRRLTILKSKTNESKDHPSDIMEVKNPACSPVIVPLNGDNFVQEKPSASSHSNALKEHEKAQKEQSISQLQGQEPQRMSLGRPVRRAAEKVNSYKEVPLNVKMRRSE